MATAGVKSDHHNEILQCSICIDVFIDPRTLPCLHSFCFRCIADWSKDKQPGSKVACPECRQEFSIPDGGMDGLRKNVFLGSLLSLNEMKQKTKRMCEVCPGPKKKTSHVFCLQCEQSYCESCGSSHCKMKISSSHELVSLETLGGDGTLNGRNRLTYCKKHKDELIKVYCLEDDVAICLMCSTLDHRSHRCEEVKQFADECRVAKWYQDLQISKKNLDEKLEMLNKSKLGFFDNAENIETEISDEADRRIKLITTLIQTQKQKLLGELREIKTNYEQQMKGVVQEFSQAKSLLKRFTNYCDQLFTDGSDVDVCREVGGLRQRAEELVNTKHLEDESKNLDITKILFSPPSVTDDDKLSIVGHVKAVVETLAVVTCSERCDDNHGVTGIALLNSELFVTREHSSSVSVYSDALQLKRTLRVPRLVEPIALAACSKNKLLFISDYETDKIHKVDILSKKITSWFVEDEPYGLSVSTAHQLIVTCCNKIKLFTPSGELMSEITRFTDPWHAVETEFGETMIVSRSRGGRERHGIEEITWEGEVVRSFGNVTGSDRGQLNYPQHFAVDSKRNILIADCGNNRIQLLDSSFTTARTLPLPVDVDLQGPNVLCFDESRGRLYIGENKGHYRLLMLDNVFNL